MKKYTSVILSIFLLVSIVGGTGLWVRAFYASIRNYRSPLQTVELQPQPPVSSHPTKVVLVLISGLGYDASNILTLPILEQLRRAGASLAVESIPPTYSQTAWTTLVTGAPPEINDAPPLDLPLEELHLLKTDTIFARAHNARLKTALLGPAEWRRLIPRNQLDYTFFVDQPGPEADEAIVEAVLPLINGGKAELVLVHFTELDFAGQNLGGAAGEAYQQAAQRIDTYLGQISAAMDLTHSVLVVMADHGHIPDGGHGGAEAEVIWQPLVLIGEKIIPGRYSDAFQIDIVPTVSALLGLATPTASQGRILYELLWLNEQDRTIAQLSLARQRLALAEAYIARIEETSPAPIAMIQADLVQAQTSLAKNNVSGAFQLAKLVQEEANQAMTAAKNHRLNAENLPRLIVTVLITFFWFAVMWRRRGVHAGSILIAAIATIALYHVLFQLQGYSYSISSLKDFSKIPLETARRTGVSLLAGGGLVLVFLILVNEENWLTMLGTVYGFSVLTTFIFALPVCWAFWQNGFVADWRLPGVIPAFWQAHGLLETMIAATLGLIMPWPIMSLSLLVNLVRSQLSESRTRTDTDVLPGLHL